MESLRYPFSAIVGQDAMKTALILNAVDPGIGGVLIRGHKGTGKTTAARALAQLLPEIEVVGGCPFNSDPGSPVISNDVLVRGRRHAGAGAAWRPMPFVELPLNATEDRLVGSLHIEETLKTGKQVFEPGLLAAANRGILYVDEVNLLDDHLVDMLLDAAASGINVVEREGISFSHPARFILIGTMNPEEGELRPQFLDRFGLCAAVDGIADPVEREEIVRRHLGFEADRQGFLRTWRPADHAISRQILQARTRLHQVEAPQEWLAFTVRVTQQLQVQGHRADITVIRAARAHAALLEKGRLEKEDIIEAARLAVAHRMRSSPLDSAERLRAKIDQVLRDPGNPDSGPRETADDEPAPDEVAEQIQVPGSMAAGSILFSFLLAKAKETVFDADPQIGAADVDVEGLLEDGAGRQRRSAKKAIAGSGRYRRAVPVKEGERGYDLALDATMRQAALRHVREGRSPAERLSLKSGDLQKKQYLRPCESLIVFAVDASDSMGAGAQVRMKAAKGAVLALLRKAYQNRSEIALVAFGGEQAKVILPPTSSTDRARRLLENLPTGGATPFADGLYQAWQLIRAQRIKQRAVRAILVIISDGEANVPMAPGVSPLVELESLAEKIRADGITALLVDAAAEHGVPGVMRTIAGRMGASYVTMRSWTAARLVVAVRKVAES